MQIFIKLYIRRLFDIMDKKSLSEGQLAGKSRATRYRIITKIKAMERDRLRMNNQRPIVIRYVQ